MLDSQNNATLVPEARLLDEPKECLRGADGILADAILAEQAKSLWKLTTDQLGPDSQKQIIAMLLNSKIWHLKSFECENLDQSFAKCLIMLAVLFTEKSVKKMPV